MRSLRKILYSLAALVLLLVVIGVFLPSAAHVEQKITIDAWPATVFALLNDLHRTVAWFPPVTDDLTNDGKVDFSGPRMGAGAVARWPGKAAEQSLTVVDSVPYQRVALRFERGRESTLSNFSLRRVDDGTEVSWQFEVDFGSDLIGRYAALLPGGDLGRAAAGSLTRLKSMAESLPRADFSDLTIEWLTVQPFEIAWLTTSSPPDTAAVSEALGKAFFRVLEYMDRNGLKEAGPPLAIHRGYGESGPVFDAAIPVRGTPGEAPASAGAPNDVKLGTTYGGPVVRATHIGSYVDLERTRDKVDAYLAAHGIERNGDPWEAYLSDPARTPESDLRTYLYYPIARPSGRPIAQTTVPPTARRDGEPVPGRR